MRTYSTMSEMNQRLVEAFKAELNRKLEDYVGAFLDDYKNNILPSQSAAMSKLVEIQLIERAGLPGHEVRIVVADLADLTKAIKI